MQHSHCYIIAEIGVNHGGSLEMARALIDAACAAKADAVKFQTFSADDLVTRTAEKADYQKANTQNAGSQYQMLKELELGEADYAELYRYSAQKGVDFLSTPFSENAADLLDRIGVDRFKISSGDLTHLDLLRHIARKGRPMIVSTGMATLSEVEEALTAIRLAGDVDVSLLHCVSNYPAAAEDCNLAAMATMSRAFGKPVGWSDHTMGSAISWAAVALGARIIEKHITLDRTLPGPDHLASMEPDEFSAFVSGIRAIEAAIGNGQKQPTAAEQRTALVGRRSIVTRRSLKTGAILTADDVKIVRPGTGLAPRFLGLVLGCRLARDVEQDHPLTGDDFHG